MRLRAAAVNGRGPRRGAHRRRSLSVPGRPIRTRPAPPGPD